MKTNNGGLVWGMFWIVAWCFIASNISGCASKSEFPAYMGSEDEMGYGRRLDYISEEERREFNEWINGVMNERY